MAEVTALAAGSRVAGRYEIVRRLSTGGMGIVYEALDSETNRRRALKILLPTVAIDEDLRSRFRQEARVSGRVESEHVVEVFDAGIDEATGSPFLVMELLRGEDLGALLKREARLSKEDTVTYLAQVALGLERTHAEGVVHRDLKLENLFLTRRDDGSPRIKILDFGIAKVVAETGTLQTTRSVGTPLYMAPEQFAGDGTIDYRADLYSLALLAYTLLVGTPYFRDELDASKNLYAFIMKVARGTRHPPSERARVEGVELPPAFDDWFARASATDPVQRFDSAREQIAALAEALDVVVPPGLQPVVEAVPRAPQAEAEPAALPAKTGSTTAVVSSRPIGPHRARRITAVVVAAGAVLVAVVLVARHETREKSLLAASVSAPSPAPAPASLAPRASVSVTLEPSASARSAASAASSSADASARPAPRPASRRKSALFHGAHSERKRPAVRLAASPSSSASARPSVSAVAPPAPSASAPRRYDPLDEL